MSRRPRLVIPEVPLHIIQRGNNRSSCFRVEADYLVYLDHLQHSGLGADCSLHAYVLMGNHIHLLLTPHTRIGPGKLVKSLSERYVQYFNRRHGRTGSLWEGRFRSCPVDDERYFLTCQRYIELNPVRAGMVALPDMYRWSSFMCNAHGLDNEIVTPHPAYLALGQDVAERLNGYRALFDEAINVQDIEQLRAATNSNYPFGSTGFALQVELETGSPTKPGKSGRPQRD